MYVHNLGNNSEQPNFPKIWVFQNLNSIGFQGMLGQSNIELMMNVDNIDMDLGLALSISNQCVQTIWNNNSGAGVNAGSRLDKKFVASDRLKELVWSPQKGPSLKCASHSFADKKFSYQWDVRQDVRPSNIVCSPSHSIISKGTKDKKSTSEGNLVASQGTGHLDNGVAKTASLGQYPRSDCPLFGASHDEEGGNIEEVNSIKHSNGKEDNDKEEKSLCNSKSLPLGIVNTTVTGEISAGQADQRTANLLPLLSIEARPGMEESGLLLGEFKEETGVPVSETEDIGKDHRNLGLEIALASRIHSVKQCEAVDIPSQDLSSPGRRNMELAVVIKDTEDEKNMNDFTCANDIDKLEATAENDMQHLITRDACEPIEKKAERVETLPIDASSTVSRMHLYQWKGKEKVKCSWDNEIDDRMTKDVDDESQGSIESCNSAKLFSKGKRRWSFDHQFIVGSKRIKRQIQESPSTSLVKQDSSFMNWISNMVKGLAKSNEEEGRSLASTTDFRSHEREKCDPKISSFNTTRDGCSRKMGFDTIFQSIYLPSKKVNETRTPLDNYPGGGSKELALACKTSGNIVPVSCHGENQKSSKQRHLPNHSCKQSAFRILGEPSTYTQLKNVNVSNLACIKAKDGLSSSNSSQGEKENTSARGNSTDPSAEGKPINSMGNVSNARGSLWITRYAQKVPFHVSNLDQYDQSVRPINYSINQKSSEASHSSTVVVSVASQGGQKCAPYTESSICSKKNGGNKHKKSVKQQPSESLKSPDEMTSLFARRLDALKHISSEALRDDASHTRRNCFFCGKSGHMMQDCSDIAENELEGLLRNSSLYNGAEKYTLLCIKCFQLDHWAAACPLSGEVKLGRGSKRCFSLLQKEESQSKLDSICNTERRQKRNVFSEKGNMYLDEIQNIVAPSAEEDKILNKQLKPLRSIAIEQVSDGAYGMFDAVRKLRLSRTDVLKWMNSHFSLSTLDGYFLRLRLGKWKEGPGGAGYYVACITGSKREKSPKGSKNPLYVTVGGVECVVESQYVSNQDFQEDELMAWWQKTAGTSRIPAEADLKVKLEERKKLGF